MTELCKNCARQNLCGSDFPKAFCIGFIHKTQVRWEEVKNDVAEKLADKVPLTEIIGTLEDYKKHGMEVYEHYKENEKIIFSKPFEQAIIKVIRKQRNNRRLWGR